MYSPNTLRCTPKVKVNTPQRSTEGVGEPRRAFVIEGIGFPEDIRNRVVSQQARLVQLRSYRRDCHRMVHQRALEGDSRLRCTTNIATP